ncbi:MAG: glycosyltransferase family 2 protein, partial [Planctomycetota bacterium]
MKLIGLMHVRNEEWVLGASLPAALRVVDRVALLDHDSTDDTPAIIDRVSAQHPGRIVRVPWQGRHYNEATMRQRTLEEGRRMGGTHFFWLDADEILCHHLIDPVRDAVAALMPAATLELPWLAMWESLDRFRNDSSIWTNNFKAFAFADHPEINYRSYRDGYDMHQAARGTSSSPSRPFDDQCKGGVMHLQFVDRRRLIAKHAWYKMSETVRFPGRNTAAEIDARYNQAIDQAGLGLQTAPES